VFNIFGPSHNNPRICSTPPVLVPVSNGELATMHPGYKKECNLTTDKVEGFADDGSIIGQASPVAINAIKQNLDNFAVISGLKCNVEKSQIMPIGLGPVVLK
jgi:hypothetical protein